MAQIEISCVGRYHGRAGVCPEIVIVMVLLPSFLPVSVARLISGNGGKESDSPDSSDTDVVLSPPAHIRGT